jgi:hypothetical protein
MDEKTKERELAKKGVLDFEQDIEIDPNALDVEWMQQPHLTAKYGEALAHARAETDRAKERLEVVKAEVDRDVRENPREYTGSDRKPTEGAIANIVIENGRVREAEAYYIERRELQNLLYAITQAIDAKKSSLENMVRLMGMQYFAGPKEPRDLGKEYGIAKQADKAMRTKSKENIDRAKRRRKRD